MEYSNVRKLERQEEWYPVPGPCSANRVLAYTWCREHSSTGKFYKYFAQTDWWFERKEDALLFTLRWSEV